MENYKKKAALFLTSQSITLLGSSIVQFAIVWYVTLQTSSGVWVSAMTVAAYVPQFLISFFSGAWADRYPKKRLIILADSLIAVTTGFLVILMPYIEEGIPLMLALIIILIVRSFGTGIQTPAVNAMIPQLVPVDKLMKYNGINATIQSVVQFAAPAVAGLVLTLGKLRDVLWIDVITAIIGLGILAVISIPFVKTEETPHMLSEIKEGLHYAVKERFIGLLLFIFGVFIFLCVPAGFLATLFVERYYGSTYWYVTITEVIGFIGMTAGGLLIGTWGGFRNRVKSLAVGIAVFGVLGIGMGAVNSFVVYLILMAVYGIALTMVQTASMTLIQEKTTTKMQGRVFGLYGAIYSGFLPLGMLIFGPLADVVSLRFLMIVTGVLLVVMAIFITSKKTFYRNGVPQEEKI